MRMPIAGQIPARLCANNERKKETIMGIPIRPKASALRARSGLAFVAIVAAAAFCLPLTPWAQESDAAIRLQSDIQKAKSDMAQAKKDIAKADAEIAKTDSLLREEAARASQSEDRLAKDRERREKENQDLLNRLHDAQAKVNGERAIQSRHINSVDETKARQKSLSLTLAGYCDSLTLRIGNSLPWDRESRLDRAKSLKKDLESGSASVDEGFARLNAMVKEEVKAGDEIAVFNKPITRKNGDVVNAQVLKIGNQWLLYMDDEGKKFGVLERKPTTSAASGLPAWTWEWREDPSFMEKNLIRTALEVKSAKRPPQLVSLNLGIVLGESKAAKGAK